MNTKRLLTFATAFAIGGGLGFTAYKVFAHCDTVDGPVIKAAKKALETGNINYAMIWVAEEQEKELKRVFEKTMSVRKLGKEAQEVADNNFFETLVRLHREHEGAPYTGIKPEGTPVEPAVALADKSIESGDNKALKSALVEHLTHSIDQHFNEVIEKKKYNVNNLKAGREYVKAYVEYVHLAERLHEATTNKAHGHYEEQHANQN